MSEEKVKLTKFQKLLKKKIEKWGDNPFDFQKEKLEFLKEHASKDMIALEMLMQISASSNDPFSANEGLISYIRENSNVKRIFELYLALYNGFSDTPDEALWAANILNEVEDDDVNLLNLVISLHGRMNNKEKSLDLYEKTKEKFPDSFNELSDMQTYLYSEIPEYIEKGKEIAKNFDIEKVDPVTSVNVGSLKFYAGFNYDGLIYHFGGEDFRPSNFLSKKPIPNHKTVDFNDKSIVVTPYRGMGDSMILSRFIPKFLEKWPRAKITISTEKPMIPLYKNMKGIHSVGTMESCAGKSFDHCLGVNMLSRYLREILVDDQGRTLYNNWVTYPESYDEKWKDIINKDESKPLIGINWKGSQRLGGTPGGNDKNLSRDLELREFIGIVDMYPHYNFVVLNNDIWDDEREMLTTRTNVILTDKIRDFGDTAALINLCDVVISIDTSVSTLSASMSKDTIVIAKFWPDYRWLHYEKWWDLSEFKVQVFRKEKYNDGWTIPVMKAAIALKDYAK